MVIKNYNNNSFLLMFALKYIRELPRTFHEGYTSHASLPTHVRILSIRRPSSRKEWLHTMDRCRYKPGEENQM